MRSGTAWLPAELATIVGSRQTCSTVPQSAVGVISRSSHPHEGRMPPNGLADRPSQPSMCWSGHQNMKATRNVRAACASKSGQLNGWRGCRRMGRSPRHYPAAASRRPIQVRGRGAHRVVWSDVRVRFSRRVRCIWKTNCTGAALPNDWAAAEACAIFATTVQAEDLLEGGVCA